MTRVGGSHAYESAEGRWVLVATVLGSGIVFLDSTIVTVALPQIGRDLPSPLFGALEGQSYVYYGYLLSLSALLVLAGALTDHHGRRSMYLVGLVGFALTSVLCGLAPNMELLVVFRVLQGAAGALLVPGSLAILTAAFHGEDQSRAFGVWAGASALTTIVGPPVGGALVAYGSWRAAFLINVPLLALAVYATLRHVVESRDEQAPGRFDWLGAGVVALAVGGLSLGVVRAGAEGWRDPAAFVTLGVGVLATVGFPWLMARRRDPLVPLSLFRSRNFSVTNVSTLLVYGALYVMLQYFALFAIGTLAYNEPAFGLAAIPGDIFLVVFAARFGALAARHGPRVFMALGPAIMGLGVLWLARIPADSAAWVVKLGDPSSFVPPSGYVIDVLPAMVLFGLGLMVMVAPLTAALMASIPERHSGVASAVNNAISRVGPQLAGALLFVAITASFYGALADALPGTDVSSPAARERISPLNAPPSGASPELATAIREASTAAFRLAMVVVAALCFAGAIVNALGIRNPRVREGAAPAARPEPICPPMPASGARVRQEVQTSI